MRGPAHGTYKLQSIPFDQGFAKFPRRKLLTLVSKGRAAKRLRPREEHGKPGTVLIRMRFRTFTGKAVLHCHILFHEDNAMMGIIQFKKQKH